MTVIQNVALLGKGFLGSAVLDQLVKAGFSVTVLTRSRSSIQGVPTGVEVTEVDYASADSLEHALRGHDAVVSTISPAGFMIQKPAIDASIRAGVKRFIPADFGALSTAPEAQGLPVHARPLEIQNYLKEKAHSGELEYTIFAVGVFLDYIVSRPTVVDSVNRTAVLYDNGEHPFSATSLASIGKAVVGALKNADATRNRVLYVHDMVLTQRKVLALAKKYSPPAEAWTESSVDAEATLADLGNQISEKGMQMPLVAGLFKAAVLSGKYPSAYKKVDNEMLGLGIMDEEALEAMFAANL
ncbi:isoflavone reductase-like protein [Aspergillus udagawae]|nr:isoflavone reductase-like protein [Aspergillus udagawae]